MSQSLGELSVGFGATTTGLSAGVKMATSLLSNFRVHTLNIGQAFRGLGVDAERSGKLLFSSMAGIGKAFIATAAIVGIAAAAIAVDLGIKAVKAAGDFQQSITKLYTTAGELHNNLGMVSSGILGMSVSVATGAQQLAQGMYWIESGGAHGKKGLDDLRIAAMAAKAENSNLDDVARALMGTLNAYKGTGLSAAAAMNTLIASTANGMMTLQELSGAISKVLPASAKFHISLIDIGAGLATMTAQGDNADMAATHLRQVILALESPAKAGAKSLAAIGLTTKEVADKMRVSLPGAIEMITTALGKKFPEGSVEYNTAIKNIAGGNKQLLALLELSGKSLQTYKDNVAKVTDAVKKGGSSVMGWADVQHNFNFKIDQAHAAINNLFIKVGTALLPAMSKLMDMVVPLITQFSDWAEKNHIVEKVMGNVISAISTIITTGQRMIGFFQTNGWAVDALKVGMLALAAAIGVSVVAALVSAVIAAGPFLLIGAAVALAIYGIITACDKWGLSMDGIGTHAYTMRMKVEAEYAQLQANIAEKAAKAATTDLKNVQKHWNDVYKVYQNAHTDIEKATALHELRLLGAHAQGDQAIQDEATRADETAKKAKKKATDAALAEQKRANTDWNAMYLGMLGTIAGAIGNWFTTIWGYASDFFNHLGDLGKGGFGPIPTHAKGVQNASRGWAVVGEEGPELLYMRGGENIYPHTQSMAMMSGGGGSIGSGGGGTPQIIGIYLDGMLLAEVMGNSSMKLIQLRHGVRTGAA